MNWTAGLASEVATQLNRAWTVERTSAGSIQLHLTTTATSIDPEERIVFCNGSGPACLPYDILVLAVGVGTERRLFGTPTYWENDSLTQLYDTGPSHVLVSGNGDGALVDVIRAVLTDFDHARLMTQFLSSSEAYALTKQVSEIEHNLGCANDFDLDGAYAALDVTKISQLVQGRIRKQRKVTLNVAGPRVYRADTMALNRVLVECLRRSGLILWFGRVRTVATTDGGKVVTLDDGTERSFDTAVFRHGPSNDLATAFPALAEAIPRHDSGELDCAREPWWPENYFASAPTSWPGIQNPVAYDVVELGEGFGLTSRAWSMNERGFVVGWTQLPRSADHAFFVWSGSGLPPELGNVPGIQKMAAIDINSVGDYIVASEGGSGQAWLISGSRLTVLKSIGTKAMPYSVNDNGLVVGWCDDVAGRCRPCIWNNGEPELLEDRGLGGVALQINNVGIVVGEVIIHSSGRLAGARWRSGRLELYEPPAPYYSARAFRVNKHGLTVGYLMQNNMPSDFFLWPLNGDPVVVGQGEAYGVNDSGWITGRAGSRGAFLYRDGNMLWFDQMVEPVWQIIWPFRLINDMRIVGVGRRNGVERAVLLVPRYA